MESLVKAPFLIDGGNQYGQKVRSSIRLSLTRRNLRRLSKSQNKKLRRAETIVADEQAIAALSGTTSLRTGLQREFLAGERPPIARKTRS